MTLEALSVHEYVFAVWKLVIRPPRRRYTRLELCGQFGNRFRVGGNMVVSRTNYEITNERGLTLVCTIFEPENPAHTAKTDEKAVVVCCHGNACSRLDAFLQVYCFLPLNIAVCCFDFSGSGMSGGEYVSLGYFERDDLAAVIQNLREKRGYTRVGVWGRSMGASTAVLHGSRDPSLAGIVADSPFSDLWNLMQEIVNSKLRLPSMMCRAVFEGIRVAIRQQANFDICEVSPKKHLESCFVPILFLHGDEDGFVQPHHSEILKQGWQGEASRFTMPSTDHNDHRQEKFLARATLFMVRALRWEDYLDQMALKILEHGLLPTQANRQIVEQKVNGSATLRAAAEFEQLALSEDIRKMTACKDPAVRQQGLVLAAAELSGAYRGAERLAVGQSGSLKMQMPAAFQGKICFAKDDTEVAFGWVGGTVPSLGYIVQFAVLSATALSISRVILKPLKGGQGFSCQAGVELMSMEAVELPLHELLDFQLFMPAGHAAQLVIKGHVTGTMTMPENADRLEPVKFLEPCCWCWRQSNSQVVVNLAPAKDLDPPSPRQWQGRQRTATLTGYGDEKKDQLAEELASMCLGASLHPVVTSPKHATIIYYDEAESAGSSAGGYGS